MNSYGILPEWLVRAAEFRDAEVEIDVWEKQVADARTNRAGIETALAKFYAGHNLPPPSTIFWSGHPLAPFLAVELSKSMDPVPSVSVPVRRAESGTDPAIPWYDFRLELTLHQALPHRILHPYGSPATMYYVIEIHEHIDNYAEQKAPTMHQLEKLWMFIYLRGRMHEIMQDMRHTPAFVENIADVSSCLLEALEYPMPSNLSDKIRELDFVTCDAINYCNPLKTLALAGRYALLTVLLKNRQTLVDEAAPSVGVDVQRARQDMQFFKEFLSAGGWLFWAYRDFAFVVTKPAAIRTTRCPTGSEIIHADDRPTVTFGDGSKLFVCRGIPVPPDVILAPEAITGVRIREEQNAAVRRAMLARIESI